MSDKSHSSSPSDESPAMPGMPAWALQNEILKRELGEFQNQFLEHKNQTQSTLSELLNLMRLQADARFTNMMPQVSATTTTSTEPTTVSAIPPPPPVPTTQVNSNPNITLPIPAAPTTYYGSSSSTQQPQTRPQSTLNTSVPMTYIPPQNQQPAYTYAVPAPLPVRPNLGPVRATNPQAVRAPPPRNPNPNPYQAPQHQPNQAPYHAPYQPPYQAPLNAYDDLDTGSIAGSEDDAGYFERNRYKNDDDRGLRIELPEFDGGTNPDDFLEWIHKIERVFECKDYTEEKMCKLAVLKFKDYASLWYENVKKQRARDGKSRIRDWSKLKKLLMKRFLPRDHMQELC